MKNLKYINLIVGFIYAILASIFLTACILDTIIDGWALILLFGIPAIMSWMNYKHLKRLEKYED